MKRRDKPASILGLMSLALCLAGCAEGFVPELRSLNPWVRKQWQEDEQFGLTFHRQVADLTALRGAAKTLSPIDREAIALELASRLKDEPSAAMRMELVRALGELQAESAQAAIVSSLSDGNTQVRALACKAIAHRQTPENLQSLAKVVAEDADLDVRIAAAREIGKFRDPAAAQALRPALDDRDASLQAVAMNSLRGITGRREFANSVPTWRQYLDGGNPAPPEGPSLAESLQKYLYWY